MESLEMIKNLSRIFKRGHDLDLLALDIVLLMKKLKYLIKLF